MKTFHAYRQSRTFTKAHLDYWLPTFAEALGKVAVKMGYYVSLEDIKYAEYGGDGLKWSLIFFNSADCVKFRKNWGSFNEMWGYLEGVYYSLQAYEKD